MDQITNVGSHVRVTNDTEVEVEDKNIYTSTNEKTTKAPFELESGLNHSRFPGAPDPVPGDFRSTSTDPEPVDIRRPTAPNTMSADIAPPSTSDPEHSDFTDPGAATSKNSNDIVHATKLTDSFSSQSSRRSTRRRKPPDRLTYRHS